MLAVSVSFCKSRMLTLLDPEFATIAFAGLVMSVVVVTLPLVDVEVVM
jgi:hypothetical protein